MSAALLEIHISLCVPIAIADLQRRGGPLESDYLDAIAFASELASKGDQILYREKDTAALVSRLMRALAVMAFTAGGVRFGDVVYCALHCPGGLPSKGLCPKCAEARP